LKDERKNRVLLETEESGVELKKMIMMWATHGIFINNVYYPPHKIDKIDIEPD